MNHLIHTRVIMPNKAPATVNRRYVGKDILGRDISGVIIHGGKYATGSVPVTYVVALDEPIGKERTAQVAASVIEEHLKDLELLASMDRDNE